MLRVLLLLGGLRAGVWVARGQGGGAGWLQDGGCWDELAVCCTPIHVCALTPIQLKSATTTRPPTIRCTNQLHEDLDAWHPLLPANLAGLPAWQRALTALLVATPLKFFSSIGAWARHLQSLDLRLHPKAARGWVWLSWAGPLVFVAAVWPALIAAGGLGGLVTYWLGPWLAFHAWLSVLSLVQHTGPHIAWAEEVSRLKASSSPLRCTRVCMNARGDCHARCAVAGRVHTC